jgi:hypothetical protein
MKHEHWAMLALLAAPLMGTQPAVALDDAEITHLAKLGILETYLDQFCDLGPSKAARYSRADELKEIIDSENSDDSAPYDKWTADQKTFAAQYAGLIGKGTRAEFCARLKTDYEAAGGELVAKP